MKKQNKLVNLDFQGLDEYERIRFLSINNSKDLAKDKEWLRKITKANKKVKKEDFVIKKKINLDQSIKISENLKLYEIHKEFLGIKRSISNNRINFIDEYNFTSDDKEWIIEIDNKNN
ncbi:hypothetical protein MCANUF31_02760 [Mycoplasmopsis canis UF31]|uniref:hypothetical protein n=1 Tax=Mycoplasmopsis canis TaxID=29555 RepID=UPI00025AEC90|nr:hypothetical protein [Mycoplasmopsis canis]EIE39282.1 hypothetical protein MCANUF33_02735 [Mycoplasmopsis canis UF33]EIE39587.1 hypothetical protein MCANUF31_02760 [Mycoplasmopsis canis UF31]EIE41223.1 hypothetical protein MCANUFG1_02710 [Mycoplasmopsis canis UFG1]